MFVANLVCEKLVLFCSGERRYFILYFSVESEQFLSDSDVRGGCLCKKEKKLIHHICDSANLGEE